MRQFGLTPTDVLNLCGGIPLPTISGIHVNISSQYAGALTAEVATDQYQVIRTIDMDIRRIDNRSMVVDQAFDDEDKDWQGYYFWANFGFVNTETEEFNQWAAARNLHETSLTELMQSEGGRNIWRQSGYSWIGEFILDEGHICSTYLKAYLKRKGIDWPWSKK